MEVHKITLIIIDHDEVGGPVIKEILEKTKYPNYCIEPEVRSIETVDIGEWFDDHSLNSIALHDEAIEKIFPS